MPDVTTTNLDLNNLQTGETKTEAPVKPEWVQDKFWDAEKGEVRVEDLAKSYGELEKTRPAPASKDPEGTPKIETAEKIVTEAGLDWSKVQEQVVSSGKLDDASIAAIEKLGVPREMIDGYLEMAREVGASITVQAQAHAGGEDKLNELLGWAQKNLTDARKEEFNVRLGKRDGWRDALTDLQALRAATAKTAGEPTLTGGGSPSGSTAGYASREEMMRDMQDPRYGLLDHSKSDPVFRQMVADKMAATRR